MTTTTPRKLLPPLLLLLTLGLVHSEGRPAQTDSGSAPKVSILIPVQNVIRYGVGLTFIAGTVEGTDVKEVGVSIRRAGTDEEWSASKKSGRFVKGATGKWLKASMDGNNWYVPVSSYKLPAFEDLLPAGTDEMRYDIYAYARDRSGRRSDESKITIIVRR